MLLNEATSVLVGLLSDDTHMVWAKCAHYPPALSHLHSFSVHTFKVSSYNKVSETAGRFCFGILATACERLGSAESGVVGSSGCFLIAPVSSQPPV